jgi:hypothetical protein
VANEAETVILLDPQTMMPGVFEAPAAFNETVRTAYVGLGTSHARWSWSASHTLRRFDDATGLDPDVLTRSSSAQLTLRPWDRVALSGRAQRDVSSSREPDARLVTKLFGAALQLEVVPERLDASVSADWQRTQDELRRTDRRDLFVTAYGSWHAWPARPPWPGVTLTLLGSYHDVIDEVDRTASVDAYQAFVRLELRWRVRR